MTSRRSGLTAPGARAVAVTVVGVPVAVAVAVGVSVGVGVGDVDGPTEADGDGDGLADAVAERAGPGVPTTEVDGDRRLVGAATGVPVPVGVLGAPAAGIVATAVAVTVPAGDVARGVGVPVGLAASVPALAGGATEGVEAVGCPADGEAGATTGVTVTAGAGLVPLTTGVPDTGAVVGAV